MKENFSPRGIFKKLVKFKVVQVQPRSFCNIKVGHQRVSCTEFRRLPLFGLSPESCIKNSAKKECKLDEPTLGVAPSAYSGTTCTTCLYCILLYAISDANKNLYLISFCLSFNALNKEESEE
jgi:hypothetical protein